MPKVEVEILVIKTVEYSITEEIDVPQAVINNNALHNWIEENTKHWQGSIERNADVNDETYELNEVSILD